MGRQRQAAYGCALVCCVWMLALMTGGTPRAGAVGGVSEGEVVAAVSVANVLAHATQSPLYEPRVPGTPGHKAALRWLRSTLRSALPGFEVATHSFTAPTPHGDIRFTNIIASSNPRASRRLILAAHWDSKAFPFVFHGATDSAVPCAMLIELGRVFAPRLAAAHAAPDVALELVFFDGEEAFVEWSDSDSLYGSRALAAKWEAEGRIASIDALLVLDLIGSGTHTFHNAQKSGRPHFAALADIEARGRTAGWVSSFQSSPYFERAHSKLTVQDDHIPFLARSVPIVHLISIPFPSVWHTADDDVDALDREPIADLLRILGVWLAEYDGLW